jgi:hypothetical protein
LVSMKRRTLENSPVDDGGGESIPSARPRGHRAEPRVIPK